MMTKMTNTTSRARLAGAAAVAVILVAAACEAPAPSIAGPEEEAMAPSQAISVVAPDGTETAAVHLSGSEARPLLFVDGVKMLTEEISDLDPNAIERVEVLKGESAFDLYGSEGENGVIQIFTKDAAGVETSGENRQTVTLREHESQERDFRAQEDAPSRLRVRGIGPESSESGVLRRRSPERGN